MTPADTSLASLLALQATLPFVSADITPVKGTLKTTPESFEVEEVPAYLPSGEGEHLYLWIEKRGLNTHDAVRAIARALDVNPNEAGVAGLKDRHAVTRQWLSFHTPRTPGADELASEGVRVLSVARHGNKLRTGHLKGNRFRLQLADSPREHVSIAQSTLARIAERGLPNYFGAQRFGRQGDNLRKAFAWIAQGERAPGPPFLRKLFVSTLQAALFNAWLAERVQEGELDRARAGDLMRKEETGGLFVSSEFEADDARVRSWEISATGPMFGASMRQAADHAALREEQVLARFGVAPEAFERVKKAGEGTRRAARVRPEGVEIGHEDGALRLAFSLPKGSYATVLVSELTKQHDLVLGEDG